jgi:hypothetical protein
MDSKIILVSSCVRDRLNGHQQAARDCWAYHSNVTHKFFIGDMEPEAFDEVGLPWCPDNYFSLPQKTQDSLKWALNQNYDWMFRAFTDTFIDPQRFEAYQPTSGYVGNTSFSPQILFAHGGPGYWLGKREAEIIVNSPIEGPFERMEDQWVAWTLAKHGIKPVHEPLFSMGQSYGFCEPSVLSKNKTITCHLSNWCNKYDNAWMYQAYFWRYKKHAL